MKSIEIRFFESRDDEDLRSVSPQKERIHYFNPV